jgi:hypothetical protein
VQHYAGPSQVSDWIRRSGIAGVAPDVFTVRTLFSNSPYIFRRWPG